MEEIEQFGVAVLVVGAIFLIAIALTRVTQRVPVPAPVLFLLAAALASDLIPRLHDSLSILTVERIGVVALILILFDGGMHIGWRRFRQSAWPIASLGVLGTFATAGVVALAAHYLFDFDWTTAGILGAALAPTDPAVMFSVLGDKEVGGRTGTILEGESGFNDPAGIALMIGLIELATHPGESFSVVVVEFVQQMGIGLVIGVAAGLLLVPVLRRLALPSQALYPLRSLAAAAAIYGLATIAHGSGFLAVLIAGILLGDAQIPYRHEIEQFHKSLASLAEIAVFVALGLTIDLTDLGKNRLWLDGLLLALILVLVARPLTTGPLLVPVRLAWGERLFVMLGGLKGAVPILLAAFAVSGGIEGALDVYGIVFVVVAFSVIAQGTGFPWLARRLGVPMRAVTAPAES